MDINKDIRRLEVKKTEDGKIVHVGLIFGPHHFLDVRIDKEGEVKFSMGCTHHGFEADASEVEGELYQLIEETRRNPNLKVKVIDNRLPEEYI